MLAGPALPRLPPLTYPELIRRLILCVLQHTKSDDDDDLAFIVRVFSSISTRNWTPITVSDVPDANRV